MRRRRQLCAAAPQDGFALMAVLAVIGLTSLVIVALLGLLLTTIRVTEQQERNARELRAADGAITATINHLRLNQTDAGNACLPAVPSEGFRVPFPEIEGPDDVKVTCRPATDEYGPSGGQVELVGDDGYAGAMTDWSTAWPWAALPGGSPLAGKDPSLIHLGSQDLRFNGNVNAANGTAALRDPFAGTPAVTVRGSYAQGPAGIGGTGCGLLDDADGPTRILATGGLSCGTPVVPPAPQDYAIDQTERTVSGGCPAGPVVTFEAGRYDQDDVAVLNGWFDGSCPDRTFYFPTGIYWFDANDGAAPPADRHALVFDDDSSSFVFGEANNWDPASGAHASAFPNACKAGVSATTPGASIVLSGRTEFRHLAGRLAVCPFVSPGGEAYPTILQQDTAPNAVRVVSATSPDWTNAANLLSGSSATPADVYFTCSFPFGVPAYCNSSRSFEVGLESSASGDVQSALLVVTGDEVNQPVSTAFSRTAQIEVTLRDGTTCAPENVSGSPDRARSTAYELVSGTCDDPDNPEGSISDSAQLDGARVNVTYTYRYVLGCGAVSCPLPLANAQRLSIWNVGVKVDARPGSATLVDQNPTGTWTGDLDDLLLDDATGAVALDTPCRQTWCGFAPDLSIEGAFALETVSTPELSPTDRVGTVGVVVQQDAATEDLTLVSTLPGSTQITVRSVAGESCTQTFEGVTNKGGRTYYPILGDGAAACSWSGEQTGASLQGASIEVRQRLDCLNPTEWGCFGYRRPVAMSYVGLVVTSDSYTEVTRAAVHVNAAAGSSANFFGSAYLPNSALDIHWEGSPSGASIFGGQLQLFSLGSVMADLPGVAADVVCCTAPEVDARKVRLTAWIDGRPRLEVAISLPTDPAGSPEILDWTQCGRNGACAPAPPLPNPGDP